MAGRPGTVAAGRGSSRAGIRVAAMSATATQNVWPNAAASAWVLPGWLDWLAVMACCSRMANSAVPMAPAMRCRVFSVLVALGISAGNTALNAAAMDGEIVLPIPAPSTNSAAPR